MHSIMDKSAEGGLKSIDNTITGRKKPPGNRELVAEIPLNLKRLYATGTWINRTNCCRRKCFPMHQKHFLFMFLNQKTFVSQFSHASNN